MGISVVKVEVVKPRETGALANFELFSYILWEATTIVNEF
jgi:hypothetical protein